MDITCCSFPWSHQYMPLLGVSNHNDTWGTICIYCVTFVRLVLTPVATVFLMFSFYITCLLSLCVYFCILYLIIKDIFSLGEDRRLPDPLSQFELHGSFPFCLFICWVQGKRKRCHPYWVSRYPYIGLECWNHSTHWSFGPKNALTGVELWKLDFHFYHILMLLQVLSMIFCIFNS